MLAMAFAMALVVAPAAETGRDLGEAYQKARAEVLRAPIGERAARAEEKLGPILRRLADLGTPESLAYLAGLLDREPDPIPFSVVKAMAGAKAPGAIDTLVRDIARRPPALQLAIVDAIGRSQAPEGEKALLDLSRNPSPILRRAGVRLLGIRASDDGFRRIIEALADEDLGTRAAAVRAVEAFRRKEMIDALIDRIGKEDGRLQGDIVKLLVKITRQNMGLAAEDWKNWWITARDRFTFAPAEEGKTSVRIRDLDYYGIEVFSKRLTFIIDCSSSMRAQVKGERATRIELAKRELVKTIEKLRPGTAINIISFNSTFRAMSERGLIAIDGQGRARAIRYVEGLPTAEGTNIYDTLSEALKDPNVDTVFFLSDGMPTRGRITDPRQILEAIRRENLARNVTIHTIAIGVRDDAGFLETLAKENGGTYVFVDQ